MTERRHFVLLSTDFRPFVGGVADHQHRLADALAIRMPVTVMTSVQPRDTEWNHAYRLVTLPPLPERRLDHRVGDGVSFIRKAHTGAYFLALRRYAERAVATIKADVGDDAAVAIGIWDTASHFWCDACRRSRLPYRLFAYGAELLLPLYGRLPEWRRRDFADSARVIACSRATADLAVHALGLTSAPAVVLPSVGPRPARAAISARAVELSRNLQRHGPVVLSVGRLVARKGFDLVIRSIARLRSEFPLLTYVVAGDGPERERLAALVRDLDLVPHVHFLGAVDDLTKWAAYDLCDVFAMPNRLLSGIDWEGFGIVFLEAALSERPSIAGRNGGVADAVVDQVTGLLVDPESPDELTGALGRLLRDERLRDRLGYAGEEAARTRFTPAAAADHLWTHLG